MNKVVAAIFLVLAGSLTLQAQTDGAGCAPVKESDWKREELQGKVKNILTYKSWFTKDEKTGQLTEGKRELEEKTSYDDQGNQIEWENENYLPADPKNALTYNYTCDAANRIVEMKIVRFDGSLFKRVTYDYDDKGHHTGTAVYFPDGTLERKKLYSLDSQGQILEEISTVQIHPEHFHPKRYDVYVTTKRTFKYDERGNATEEKDFYPDGSLHSTWINSYDEGGRLAKVVWTDKQNRLLELNVYAYGKNGKVAQTLEYKNFCYNKDDTMCEGSLTTDVGIFYYGTKTVYEYDARGNWIKQTEYEINEQKGKKSYRPISAMYRKITYY